MPRQAQETWRGRAPLSRGFQLDRHGGDIVGFSDGDSGLMNNVRLRCAAAKIREIFAFPAGAARGAIDQQDRARSSKRECGTGDPLQHLAQPGLARQASADGRLDMLRQGNVAFNLRRQRQQGGFGRRQ